MKERLLQLIDKTDEIEKLFHMTSTSPGIALASSYIIYDVQEFSIWIQELKFELQAIYDRTKSSFIWETINDLSAHFNGWKDRELFNKIKGDLLAIKTNINSFYPKEKQISEVQGEEKEMPKKSKIFISHSSDDWPYVEEIVSLLDDIGLSDEQIFCSSVPGYDIPIDKSIFDYLREQFLEFDLHIIFVHSPNYYASPISLNEMGAAWVLRSNATSILLPGFEFSEMKGVVNGAKIAIKLDNPEDEIKDKLNQLRDLLISEFGIKRKADILWEKKRNQFINRVGQLKVEVAAEQNDDDDAISQEAKSFLKQAAETVDAQILVTNTLTSGKSIQVGYACYSQSMGAMEFSKWDSALAELLKLGYVKDCGTKHEVFQVTRRGFEYYEKKLK